MKISFSDFFFRLSVVSNAQDMFDLIQHQYSPPPTSGGAGGHTHHPHGVLHGHHGGAGPLRHEQDRLPQPPPTPQTASNNEGGRREHIRHRRPTFSRWERGSNGGLPSRSPARLRSPYPPSGNHHSHQLRRSPHHGGAHPHQGLRRSNRHRGGQWQQNQDQHEVRSSWLNNPT